MQFSRYIPFPKSIALSQNFFLIFRIIFLVAVLAYLWQNLITNKEIINNLTTANYQLHTKDLITLFFVITLLPVNWLLEAKKWQIIAAINNISLKQALRGVVLGLTMDNVMPLGTGAISGRILTISYDKRLAIIPGILAGQLMQGSLTLIFGLYGLTMIWKKATELYHWSNYQSLLVIGAIIILVLILIFWKNSIRLFLKPLKDFTLNSWILIAGLSLARYLTFLLQFILLASIFSPTTGLQVVFGCATWVFAARTFMPHFSNLERLGIRALAVVFFMELFQLQVAGMLIAVIALWIINLVMPSILGLTLIRKVKFSSIFS